MSIDDITMTLENRPELLELMEVAINGTPEALENCILLMDILMCCTAETLEKGIQVLDLLKNKDIAELFDILPQIKDEKRIKALVCWAEQYKG